MPSLRHLAVAAVGIAAPAFAAEDPIAVRQALMDGNGAAAAVAVGIMKDEIAYNALVGKAVIAQMHATAEAIGSFFPEGSLDPAKSNASPQIWENSSGFREEVAKFLAATDSAVSVAGKDGPADKAAFGAAIKPMLDSCRGCHETFRVKN